MKTPILCIFIMLLLGLAIVQVGCKSESGVPQKATAAGTEKAESEQIQQLELKVQDMQADLDTSRAAHLKLRAQYEDQKLQLATSQEKRNAALLDLETARKKTNATQKASDAAIAQNKEDKSTIQELQGELTKKVEMIQMLQKQLKKTGIKSPSIPTM